MSARLSAAEMESNCKDRLVLSKMYELMLFLLSWLSWMPNLLHPWRKSQTSWRQKKKCWKTSLMCPHNNEPCFDEIRYTMPRAAKKCSKCLLRIKIDRKTYSNWLNKQSWLMNDVFETLCYRFDCLWRRKLLSIASSLLLFIGIISSAGRKLLGSRIWSSYGVALRLLNNK